MMPTVTVELDEGTQEFEVQNGVRLVLALEDNDIDVSHRCGGYAKCTTCRCDISDGEPEKMTKAEMERLDSDDYLGKFRLSCQLRVEDDMTVKPLMRVSNMDWDDPGERPEDQITPEPQWVALETALSN